MGFLLGVVERLKLEMTWRIMRSAGCPRRACQSAEGARLLRKTRGGVAKGGN
jgi:hypothetical protein